MNKTEIALQDIKLNLQALTMRMDFTRDEVGELKRNSREIEQALTGLRESLANSQTKIELTTAGIDELRKRWDESDRRRWTIYGMMVAAAVTFIANIILNILLLFLKR